MSNKGKTIKNVKSTVNFGVSSLNNMDLSEEQINLGNEFVLAKQKKADNVDELESKLVESYTDAQKTTIASYGKTLHTNTVKVEIDLGHFIYNIFDQTYVMPKAPLSQKIALKKSIAYAEELKKEEFIIPDQVFTVVKTVLEDDELWDVEQENPKLGFIVSYDMLDDKGETKKEYLSVNIKGIIYFSDVINAAVNAFDDGDVPVPKPKDEPKGKATALESDKKETIEGK